MPTEDEDSMAIRPPNLGDGARMWALVHESEALDENSPYAYLLFCSHFARTSRVAEEDGEILGFVGGYRPPDAPDAYFVWQVGTAKAARGRGVARRMIVDLLEHWRPHGVRFLEATVTTSNAASAALFRSIARRYDVPCVETMAFPSRYFPGPSHEDEILFRIGPIPDRRAPR